MRMNKKSSRFISCSSSWCGILLVMGLLWVSFIGVVSSEGGANYITWDDMKIDDALRASLLSSRRNESSWNISGIIVVDKAGRGDSVSVQGAVDMIPDFNDRRVKIYILPGIYREKVHVPPRKPYVSFIGNEHQSSRTLITWNDQASTKDKTGGELGTYRSASVSIESDYFCASGITFENTVIKRGNAEGMQAVALQIKGKNAMFYRVRILGSQDTLLDDSGNHYFLQSYIQGTVDFIFGQARSLYKNCIIHSTARRDGAIAAHHRDGPDENTGFSFVNCMITGTGKILLGRAWGNYSRVIYSHCYIDDMITQQGWSDWDVPSRQKTAVFVEYNCKGRGSNQQGRVNWAKSFSDAEVKPFLDLKFIDGDEWLSLG